MGRYKTIGIGLKNKYIIVILLYAWAYSLSAQQWDWWPLAINDTTLYADTILYQAYISALGSSGREVPFLLRANHHGNIAQAPYSGNLSVGIIKSANCPARWWDYDFGVQLTGRLMSEPMINSKTTPSTTLTGYFEQLYAHTRLYVIDITAGILPMVYGSQSSKLSMGGLLFSGNAHPVPRITIGIDDYVAIPGSFGYAEIKGGLTYGWPYDHSEVQKTKLHHKFIGLRLGGTLPFTIAYEIHHAAQWGGYKETIDYGNTFADFWNVFLFRSGGITISDQLNAQGNHIGFQEITLEYKCKEWRVKAYWQSIFEDMSAAFIGFGTNVADGLWGVNIQQNQWPFINQFTYEFLNTTSQSGPLHDKDGLVFAGRDSYYTNSAYPQGWTYFSNIIGNPYLQTHNSRVRAHMVGISGNIYGYTYRVIASYVDNYGTYKKPIYSNNTALLLEVNRRIEKAWGLEFGIALSTDIWTQYGNQFGVMLTIRKQGIIAQW